MRLSSDKLPVLLAKVIPYICLSAVGVALVLCFVLGWSNLAIKGLYLAIPVTLASGIAIWKPNLFKEHSFPAPTNITLSSLSFSHVALLFVVLYIISLCLLIGSESRPFSYFLVMGIMAVLIFVEILATEREHTGRRSIILLQIAFLLANLILGQTLKLPLYYGSGGGDLLSHMRLINTIVESGYLIPAMGDYQYFPLFHILGASATLLTGMELQTSYFLVTGLCFLGSIPIVYLLSSQVTQDIRFPLTAALLYSLSSVVILSGMYMITRTLAFIFCLLVLYLLIRERGSLRAIAVFLIFPLVLMHQTTLAYASAGLVALILIELVMYGRSHYIGYTYPMLFIITYLGYWIYASGPFFSRILKTIVSTTEPVIISTAILSEPFLISLLKEFDSTIVAFLAILGIIRLLYISKKGVDLGKVLALFSLIAFVFYFKGPASFLEPILLASRLRFPSSPFIALAAAGGILLLVERAAINRQHLKSIVLTGISLFIVFLLSFSAMVISGNQTDFPNSKVFGSVSSGYFTESELEAFSFCDDHRGSVPIYTDYNSWRYIGGYLTDVLTSASTTMFDSASVEEGYMLLREGELESRGQLLFLTGVKHGFTGEAYLYEVGDIPDLKAMWEQELKLYDSGTIQIYSK